MKKSNLSLKTRPFKQVSDDLNKEMEYFNDLLNKVITKNPLTPEMEIINAIQSELAKSKDAMETWIKGNALELLGYDDFAAKFKEKATELGYSVNAAMEHFTPKRIKVISIKENINNIPIGQEGVVTKHDQETDLITVKLDNGQEFHLLPEDQFEVLATSQTNENLVLNPEQGQGQFKLLDTTTLNNGEATSQTKQPLENDTEYNKSALIAMITADPFLLYSFHETATEDQDKDLEKFYKHYIKGDETQERNLKMFEQVYKIYEIVDWKVDPNHKGWTAGKFKREIGPIPEEGKGRYRSLEKRWSYMSFFKINDVFYVYNGYGPPGYVDMIKYEEIPADVREYLK